MNQPPMSLAARYERVRAQTTALCEPLSAEDQLIQSMPDASPVKWHLAHTSWFFERFVLSQAKGFAPFHPRYDYLFNSYYMSVGKMQPRPERGLLSRPPLDEVRRYRQHVDGGMAALLVDMDEESAIGQTVTLGLAHEQQHQELMLTDIKHAFGHQPLLPAYQTPPRPAAAEALPLSFQTYDGGLIEVGHGGDGFAFDNEGPRHRVFLQPFALANRLTTWGEYLAFMADGGYERPELWLSEGWNFIQAHELRAPLYLDVSDKTPQLFTLHGPVELQLDEPVCHLSYFEADAFARWAGARLPTEFEWEHAADQEVELSTGTVQGVRPGPAEHSTSGRLRQLLGDAWEWTSSAYSAYPNFEPASGALGEYNGKFMCGQFVLRGGSCVTPLDHLRVTYRNFFPPTARWQFSGLRLARTP